MDHIDYRDLQKALAAQKLYAGKADGDVGSLTRKAVDALLKREHVAYEKWDVDRRLIAAQQLVVQFKGLDVGEIDGLLGPQTEIAFEEFVTGKKLDRKGVEAKNTPSVIAPPPKSVTNIWPKQSNAMVYYGAVGKNQTTIKPRWPMVLAWDKTKAVTKITVHQKVADSASRVLDRIANSYTPQQLVELGVHLFGGSLNVRRMRGGTSWSMHSWGIAIDFDPERNQLMWGRDRARLGKPDAELFWKLWEEEGWVSLGRSRNYDWMHVQAARL